MCACLMPEKLDQYGSCTSFNSFDWYLLQIIVPLKPDFNCCSNFVLLSWIDKITTGTKFCVSHCECCTLICDSGRHYNAICRKIQNKFNFTVN